VGGHTVDAGRLGMAQLLDHGPPPTGVVVASVLAAVGAMAAAQERGLRVPEDLSVVGFHDVFFAPLLTPPLSVVHLPLDQLGSRGVERLLATIDAPSTSGHETVDAVPELIRRRSTAPPAG
jgi:LacI family transcriptional regulator